MKSLKHFLVGAGAIVVPALAAIAATPAVTNFIGAHPTLAVYFPILSGAIVAAYHKLTEPTPAPPASTTSSSTKAGS